MQIKICPSCGKQNPIANFICSNCGEDITMEKYIEAEPETPVKKRMFLLCRDCGNKNEISSEDERATL